MPDQFHRNRGIVFHSLEGLSAQGRIEGALFLLERGLDVPDVDLEQLENQRLDGLGSGVGARLMVGPCECPLQIGFQCGPSNRRGFRTEWNRVVDRLCGTDGGGHFQEWIVWSVPVAWSIGVSSA